MIHDYVLIPLKSQITTNFCWDTVTCLRADTEFCDAGFSLVNTFTLNSAVAKKWWSHRANRGLRWEKTPGNKKQERVCITLHWKTVCCQCGFLDLGPVGGFLSFSVVPKKKKKKDEIDTSKINILPGLTPWTPQRLVQMNQTEAECSHYLTLSDMSSQICDQTSWRWHSVHLLWTFFFPNKKEDNWTMQCCPLMLNIPYCKLLKWKSFSSGLIATAPCWCQRTTTNLEKFWDCVRCI